MMRLLGHVNLRPGRAPVPDTALGPDSDDPFVPPDNRFQIGPHLGNEMVLTQVRSAYLLSEIENQTYAARYRIRAGETAFANVRHLGHWYVARVADGAVTKAILQISHFPMPGPLQIAGHLQLRFKFKTDQPAILVPQVASDVDEHEQPVASTTLSDVVYSAEAVFAAGDEAYSLAKGFRNRFALAHRLVSIPDRQKTMTDARGNPRWVEQAEIRVPPESAQALLVNCGLAGKRDGLTRMYHTLTASCATEAIARLDETFAYATVYEVGRRLNESCIPVSGFRYLRARGLLGPRLPSLNQEFPWPGVKR